MANLYLKAGLKNVSTVFLITDSQITDEKFLVPVNDFLACGEIPDLFTDDEITNITNTIRPEVLKLLRVSSSRHSISNYDETTARVINLVSFSFGRLRT